MLNKDKKLNAEDINKVSGGCGDPIELGNGAVACPVCNETLIHDPGILGFADFFHCDNKKCRLYKKSFSKMVNGGSWVTPQD